MDAAAAAAVQPGKPAMANADDPSTAQPELTTEQQMDLIRKRIEARRAQLREQDQPPPPTNKTKK